MAIATLRKRNGGYSILSDGAESKWSIKICSTVEIGKRESLAAYYILIAENDIVGASVSIRDGEAVVNLTRSKYVVPVYVRDMVVDIMSSGNINNYVEGENIDNEFSVLEA